jgi:hypothetical protein
MFSLNGLFAMPALADSENADMNAWQFELTPYLFAAGMDGTAGIRGVSADIDMSFSDIWDRLDSAFMLYFTAQKGDWIYALDAIYFKVADEAVASWQGPLGNSSTAQLNADMTQQAYALSIGRRVLNEQTKVDVMGVARYTSLDTDLKLVLVTGTDLLPDGSRSVGRKESWWDAAIVVRLLTPIAEKWDFVAYADIGAGGSDLTYQLLAGVNWQFGKTFSAKFGYRYFYQDYQKDDFKWDMTTSGVYAGLGIKF